MGRGSSRSNRCERKTSNSCCPSAILAPDFLRSRRTRSSMRSLPRRLTAPAWDFALADPSWNRTGAACGLVATRRGARAFTSACRPKSRSMNCRESDWLVQLRTRGAFGVDRHVCVLRCSGSCRSRNGRGRLDSRGLAVGRGWCDGDRHLVHALHWDAGIHFADSRGLPLANRSTVTVCGHSRVCRCAVRGEPEENGSAPSARRKCPDGCWYCEHALYRHGCYAFTCHMPVQFHPRSSVCCVRGFDFSGCAVDYFPLPR